MKRHEEPERGEELERGRFERRFLRRAPGPGYRTSMSDLPLARRRRGVRRRVRLPCRAMSWERFEIVGERLLDLSSCGAFLQSDAQMRIGEEVLLAFRMPWLGPDVLVSASVARLVEGRRRGDFGRGVGLRFDLEPRTRAELRARLTPFEPTAPARPHPVDYALAVERIAYAADAPPGVLDG